MPKRKIAPRPAALRRRARESAATPAVITTTARPRVRSIVAPSTEDRIRQWVASVDRDARVSFGRPSEKADGRGASVYLLDISQLLPARALVGRPPLQLWLRHLVTTWDSDIAEANRLLLDLAYAAEEQRDMEIETHNVPPETWLALQTVARPSFVLRISATRARATPVAKPVLHPLRLEAAPPIVIGGVVRTSTGMPLADAVIVLPSIARETVTDGRGRFQLVGVPGPPLSQTLVLRAKGMETTVDLPKDPARARALVIEFDPVEEGTHA